MSITPQHQTPNFDCGTPTVSVINERSHFTRNGFTTHTVNKTGEDTIEGNLNNSWDTKVFGVSSLNSSEATLREDSNNNEEKDLFKILKNIGIANVDCLTIGQLDINSIRNTFDGLKSIVSRNMIT